MYNLFTADACQGTHKYALCSKHHFVSSRVWWGWGGWGCNSGTLKHKCTRSKEGEARVENGSGQRCSQKQTCTIPGEHRNYAHSSFFSHSQVNPLCDYFGRGVVGHRSGQSKSGTRPQSVNCSSITTRGSRSCLPALLLLDCSPHLVELCAGVLFVTLLTLRVVLCLFYPWRTNSQHPSASFFHLPSIPRPPPANHRGSPRPSPSVPPLPVINPCTYFLQGFSSGWLDKIKSWCQRLQNF